jgi:hypothetical protein
MVVLFVALDGKHGTWEHHSWGDWIGLAFYEQENAL